MVSGVLAKIYEQVCEFIAETYHELEAEIDNGYHEYEKSYRERHGRIKVSCVGMRKPIQLDDVYVAVQFLNEKSMSKYRSMEDAEMDFFLSSRRVIHINPPERQDGTKVANSTQYLMVLGGPGVGKSTFLRKVGLEILKGKNGNFSHQGIPVFLELKRFTEDQIEIEKLITDEFKTCGFPHPEWMTKTALDSGQLLILFDGLDEVPTENVDNVIRKIGDFVDLYSKNRFIASCRIAAYTGGFARFDEVEMAEFNDSQIKEYINNWFASTPDPNKLRLDEEMNTAEKCWNVLNTAEHQATKELAGNPLLLAMLCIVYDDTQNFPRNRADLYEKALNILLEKWAAEKRVTQNSSVKQYLDVPEEKRMLSKIAATNFEAERLFIKKNELIEQIKEFGEEGVNTSSLYNPSRILETIAVEQGLFVERVSGYYSFSHLTFQEYLTANYIVGNPLSIKALVKGHLFTDRWHEVFLLTAGLMREADSLLEEIDHRAVKYIKSEGLQKLFRWAKLITDISDNQYSKITKQVFAIRQFFALWMLNKIYNDSKSSPNLDKNFKSYGKLELIFDFDRGIYIDLFRGLYQGELLNTTFYIQRRLQLNLDQELYHDLNQSLDIKLKGDSNFNFRRDPDLYFYGDFYRYKKTDFYPHIFTKFGDRFDKDLSERITLVGRMQGAKIFKDVDLRPIIQKFDEQREFIKAVRDGQSVIPPEEYIHDTWCSVLHITDDMLTIPRQEIENYANYLCAMKQIFECRESAGRVSREVWERIMERFKNWDIKKIKD